MIDRIAHAFDYRLPLLDEAHTAALRLFNGFTEGMPGFAVDVYATALVIHNHTSYPETFDEITGQALAFYRQRLPWLTVGLLKTRRSPDMEKRKGELLFGQQLPGRVRENGVWYALDLRLNQDPGFYLDTRGLRVWLKQNSAGLKVLNTFAYTGSLGAACLAGGASQALQLDLNRQFLNLAKDTCTLNGFPIRKADYITADFFVRAAQMRRAGDLFDLALLDPPLFSSTNAGRVDLLGECERLINKIRPLVKDGGRLVAINNALFLSGRDYMDGLERLCASGFLAIEELIPVPEDISGYADTRSGSAPADPAPFNHSTKIAVLRVKRK
jgi:23S rRNA (cytosine1962-C5)-methyltransferase